MRLPQADNAVIDIRKLRNYCLSRHHPRGKHKARVIEAALGFTSGDAEELADLLLAAIKVCDATEIGNDVYGRRFVIDCSIEGPRGIAVVRSAWLLQPLQPPRFLSCYVL